jgi:A/G-specific adenine glycosylase
MGQKIYVMISTLLVEWYEANKRKLPWRDTSSPYRIWLSEIILQQTRVDQGLGYYNRFIQKYPDIKDLANASPDDVLKMWQGLGYYTRARNLHKTANLIVRDHGGIFPDSYEQLLHLRGIGEYTAAAISSFAFKRPVALVDGNVFRVLARLYDEHTPINSALGKKLFSGLALELLDKKKPDIHNQAIMEFGAIICKPRNPLCDSCVLSSICLAKLHGTISLLPVKKYKPGNRIRYFNYLHIESNSTTWIKKRVDNDIWNSLYEFPMVETLAEEQFEKLAETYPWRIFIGRNKGAGPDEILTYSHKLSHQKLVCRFFRIVTATEPSENNVFERVERNDVIKFPIPRVIERYLEDLSAR